MVNKPVGSCFRSAHGRVGDRVDKSAIVGTPPVHSPSESTTSMSFKDMERRIYSCSLGGREMGNFVAMCN